MCSLIIFFVFAFVFFVPYWTQDFPINDEIRSRSNLNICLGSIHLSTLLPFWLNMLNAYVGLMHNGGHIAVGPQREH